MKTLITKNFSILIFLMMFNIILQRYTNNFNFLHHKMIFFIGMVSILYLWFSYYLTKYNKDFYRYYIVSLMLIVSLGFYICDVQHGFFLSHNAILLVCIIAFTVSNLLHSREVDLLKEQISALQEQNRQFKNDKNRFHQNIQHNHNVPVGTLKNNFEFFTDWFFRKIEPKLASETDAVIVHNLDMLKTSITLVQDNLHEALSYVEHVNAVSQKCKKENICDINYADKISVLELVRVELKTLRKKHSNHVLFKCAESEKEIGNVTGYDYCDTNNEKFKLINYNIFADKIKLSEAIYQVLKNQFKYAPTYSSEIEINIFKEYDKIVIKMTNGACIPQDELEKIFEPGTIAKANVSLAGNRGYGLTYARYVIEEHGGYLTADNIEDKTYFLAKLPIDNYL